MKKDSREITEAINKIVQAARDEAFEEAAKIAEFHSGPSIQLADKIRALAQSDETVKEALKDVEE